MRAKLVAIALLLVGPFMIVMNYTETQQRAKIAKEGIETVAMPVSATKRKGSYHANVEFKVGDSTVTERVEIDRALFDKIDSVPLLKIKYLRDAPNKLILADKPVDKPELYYVGAGLFVAGGVLCYFQFLRRKPAAA
jgi:hypothetical protein